jgi:hypothetical protein
MTRASLAPCPFGCLPGGLATMERRSPGLPLRDQECVFVCCAGCGCHGPGADSVAEARARWNERAPDQVHVLVEEQIRDEAIWFRAQNTSEAYLQAALRALHAAVEGWG